MLIYSRPETAAEAEQREAEAAEAKRPLDWTEFKERLSSMPQQSRRNDLFRLRLETVPPDVRGIYAALREREERHRTRGGY